jgi:hypothetical protein
VKPNIHKCSDQKLKLQKATATMQTTGIPVTTKYRCKCT